MSIRSGILRKSYQISPFSLKGDFVENEERGGCTLSCIINFFGRIGLLEGILYSLTEQDYQDFEVILVEDRGGTNQGKEIMDKFKSRLNIKYFALPEKHGFMGFSRNYALSKSNGKYVLFLDDDTVILQQNFLSLLVDRFKGTNADGIIPHGYASYQLLEGEYGYHESYFPTNRCTAYQRATLKELGGFVSDIIGQEDVEFIVRFLLADRIYIECPDLEYYHPPLLFPTLKKPEAVGNSFFRLRSRYSFLIWLFLIVNCARHAPLYFIPVRRFREMGRFGLGFLIGVIKSGFKKQEFKYQ